jgi:N-acetylglucosaminyldiphosphoundecaprenol N-acetyl-beta-D-mannosaminyltransferase
MIDDKDCNKKFVSGIAVHSCDENLILSEMERIIRKGDIFNHIAITNTESMYFAEKIPGHMAYINSAAFSLCDGMGSVIAGKFQGHEIKRFHGPDFMLQVCEFGQDKGWKHFFYGGKEGVADILVENLKKKYPDLDVVGTFCPPFRELSTKEEKEMIAYIKAKKPDIIWVGLGLLKQEKWIAKYQNQIEVPWAVGVGAAFDFYAGTVKRAPQIFQKFGMEWLYRLSKEPRMFKRNMNSFLFMFKAIGKGLKNRFIKKGE